MIPIRINHGLPFVSVTVKHKNQILRLDRVLLDTGSAATVFGSDQLEQIGVVPEPQDAIRFMRGVGGVKPLSKSKLMRLEQEI